MSEPTFDPQRDAHDNGWCGTHCAFCAEWQPTESDTGHASVTVATCGCWPECKQ